MRVTYRWPFIYAEIGGDTYGQRRRKTKPTAVKELGGNPGKRALNKNQPKSEKTALKCPRWLWIEQLGIKVAGEVFMMREKY